MPSIKVIKQINSIFMSNEELVSGSSFQSMFDYENYSEFSKLSFVAQ